MKILVATIGSLVLTGCATHIAEPLCLPGRPLLQVVTIEEQAGIQPLVLEKIATNEEKLKSHVRQIESITVEHNKQFKAQCAD